MSSRRIQFTIDSDLENVGLVGMAINRICLSLTVFDENDCYMIELCVVEVCNNIIEHGFNSEKGHLFSIILTLHPHELAFEITDTGMSIPSLRFMPLNTDPDARESLSEGGMGLLILQSVMQDVQYRVEADGNKLLFFKRFQK